MNICKYAEPTGFAHGVGSRGEFEKLPPTNFKSYWCRINSNTEENCKRNGDPTECPKLSQKERNEK